MDPQITRYDLVVIGGGPAGVTAALRAAELGAHVALLERGRLGGTCTNDGCVPTRALAKAARLRRDSEQFDDYGLEGPRPEVNFERLLAHTQQIVYRIHEKKQLIRHLTEAGVEVLAESGDARFLDPHTVESGSGRRIHAEKFILCPGGRPRRLNFPGADLALTHSDVWSLKTLPRSLAIVGAAATGCQLASIFQDFGAQVTLLELAKRILPAEDIHVSAEMQSAFDERGIAIVSAIEAVTDLRRDGNPNRLQLTYRRNGTTFAREFETVILAVGWPASLEALNLQAAGLEVGGGFLAVNDYLQTGVAHIYAAGDVTGRMMLVQSGGHEARLAAENAVLGNRRPARQTIVPHGGFTDPEYGSVGLTEEQARREEAILTAVVPYADLDRAVIDGQTRGMCKLVVSVASHQILGAHVVGEQAVEVVQMAAAGMAAAIRMEQLAELDLAYPTYTAIIGLAARRIQAQFDPAPQAPHWQALGRQAVVEWERRD